MFHYDLPPETFSWLLAFWFLLLGAAVGSFLNVIVYRLPAGMNIAWPGSHCPLCQHPIRWFDNVPVMSWVLLRGRCRDCRAPISIRYPLVEAGTAALFLTLAIHELIGRGVNLPMQTVMIAGHVLELARGASALMGIYAYHIVLLCTLLTAALIDYDGKRTPRRLFLPALVIGLFAPIVWPGLHPVHAWSTSNAGHLMGGIDGLLGLLVGVLLGMLATLVDRKGVDCGRPANGSATSGLPGGAACVGVMLGWQAVVPIVVAAVAVHQLLRMAARRQASLGCVPASAWLAIATLLWIIKWREIVQLTGIF